MPLTKIQTVRPFYFMRYGMIIGVAGSVAELERELSRLARDDPNAVQYHLKEGHIVEWLHYCKEKELAEELRGVESVEEARRRVAEYVKRKSKFAPSECKPFHMVCPRDSR